MKLCPVAVVMIVGGCCLAKPYHDDHYSPLGIAGATSVSSCVSESSALNHTSSHNFESSSTSIHHLADVGGKLAKISTTTIKKTTNVRKIVRTRKRSKSTYRTKVSSGVIPHDFGIPAATGASGYETKSKASPPEYASNENAPGTSNEAYKKNGLSYPTNTAYGGQYSETGYDQNSKYQSASKASRSLTDENSQTGYRTNFIAPAVIASEVSPKGYSQNSKIQAAESVSKTNSQETSNKGYTRTGASYPAYKGTYSEAGYDQKSKSASSSKASRSLSQESASNGFNNRILVAPQYGGAVGYSDSSSASKVQSSAPRFVAAPAFVEH